MSTSPQAPQPSGPSPAQPSNPRRRWLGVGALGLAQQLFGRFQERYAVGDRKADQEIDDGGNRPVGEDLDKGVDLVLLADRAQFQKGKAGVHGQHHDAAQQDEKRIRALFQCIHEMFWGELIGFGASKRGAPPCTKPMQFQCRP